MSVPPQYFQSVIALELAITGALLWQIRYFEHREPGSDAGNRPLPHPLIRLAVAVVLAGTLLGSLLGIVRGSGTGLAIGVALGLGVSVLPVLLRVLPPLGRSEDPSRHGPQAVVTIVGLMAFAAIFTVFVILLAT